MLIFDFVMFFGLLIATCAIIHGIYIYAYYLITAKTVLQAKYISCETVHHKWCKDKYILGFEYFAHGVHYSGKTCTMYSAKFVKDNMIYGNQYDILVNSKNPQIFIFRKVEAIKKLALFIIAGIVPLSLLFFGVLTALVLTK